MAFTYLQDDANRQLRNRDEWQHFERLTPNLAIPIISANLMPVSEWKCSNEENRRKTFDSNGLGSDIRAIRMCKSLNDRLELSPNEN
jgi:hypothetical protein